ncbi:MAG: hypothetical protein JWR72_2392 [Flavisolibacter sp.]|jgi:hypothetical protein|nr:hypothetical protein [Flavisolibacter sp.]
MGKPIRLLNSFDLLTDARLLERANSIHQNISGATSVFPTPLPTMASLLTAVEEFQSTVNNAASGDKNKAAVRDAEKEKLVDLLHLVSYYVLFTAAGDKLVVQLSGFTQAKPPTPQPEIPKPGEVQLTLGDQSGVMYASLKKVRGAVAYMHQFSTDPTLQIDNWVNHTCTTTKCTFNGLTPGTTYYVRVGAIGHKDQLKFSDVTSRIAA